MKQLHITNNLPELYRTATLEVAYHMFYPNTFLVYTLVEPENKPAFILYNHFKFLVSLIGSAL